MSHRHISLLVPPKRRSAVTSIPFSGEFDLTTRQKFRQIRRELGLSLQQLADFLQINWSTIRKWETGISKTCHARHVSRITNFLNHCYDERLRGINEPNYNILSMIHQLPLELRTEMEHAWTAYGVAKCYPGESSHLISMLLKVVDNTAQEILKRCLTPLSKHRKRVGIPLDELAEVPSKDESGV